ncbi:hypothetical protein HYFRA_00000879 [Hymenoscyphus fraxineus]|uniref:Uncharacterized protein n=1 Tax=Hymenoscyphus fraxineus TaxID=746836 RepID=A0A9N9KS62_9HELO|nr:hypothetical protein HYFRA_00000879 [Hymenoscyphus fraxineus]
MKTVDTDNSDYGWRPLLNKSQFQINVLALVSAAIDGYLPRHRLCDALVGQILLACYLGLVTRELAAVFHTMFTKLARLRLRRWSQAGNAGGPFLGPCGLPMRLPESEKLILLCGNPPRDGVSKWTFESIHDALLSGNMNVWFWLIQTLYAGKAPEDLTYVFGSHDISRLPIHYHDDRIGYESEDDSRGWGPGKNPLAKGIPPRGITRPSKGIYFNFKRSPYFKDKDPKLSVQRSIDHDLRQIEIFMSKCFGFGRKNKKAMDQKVSEILEHGNYITPDTSPPFILASSAHKGASPASLAVSMKINRRDPKTVKPQKELYGVLPCSDESEFEEFGETEKEDEEENGEEEVEKAVEEAVEPTGDTTEEETDEKYYDTPTKTKRAKRTHKFVLQKAEEIRSSRP